MMWCGKGCPCMHLGGGGALYACLLGQRSLHAGTALFGRCLMHGPQPLQVVVGCAKPRFFNQQSNLFEVHTGVSGQGLHAFGCTPG